VHDWTGFFYRRLAIPPKSGSIPVLFDLVSCQRLYLGEELEHIFLLDLVLLHPEEVAFPELQYVGWFVLKLYRD